MKSGKVTVGSHSDPQQSHLLLMMWDKEERINKDNEVRLPAGSVLKNGIAGSQVIDTRLIVANVATPPVHQ